MEKTIKFQIEGLTPLLQNNPKSMSMADDSVKSRKRETATEEADRLVYKSKKGVCFIPTIAIRSSAEAATSFQKIGKYSFRSVFNGAISITSEECELYNPDNKKPLTNYDEIDSRRVTLPNGNSVIRNRPKFTKWATNVEFIVDQDVAELSEKDLLDLLNRAGKMQGVGDFRPSCKGWFGKFKAKVIK